MLQVIDPAMTANMLINGQPHTHLPAADRAFQYGDGVFTTIRVKEGMPEFWPLHKQRLQQGLERLGMVFSQWQQVSQSVHDLASTHVGAVVKVLISRGEGGRGYLPPQQMQANWIVSQHPLPEHYADWRLQGISLGQSEIQLARQPLLAGIKHLNRLEQVLIRQHVHQQGWDDALVCDTDNMLVETSVANLFWQLGHCWYTPDLQFAGVEGVIRRLLIDHLQHKGHQVHQVRATSQVLMQASSVLICNSLMGIVPVRQIGEQVYPMDTARQLNKECFGEQN